MPTVKTNNGPRVNFFHFHSLSIVTIAILLLWIVLYMWADPNTRCGSFYGNAVADWSGSVVIIIATKYLFEKGSEESRPFIARLKSRIPDFIRAHSLSVFLVITGFGWFALYWHMSPTSKWGQVVGNVLSEWVQMLGLVLLTKRLIERNSKESR
jgi:hypothetical protein